MNSSTLSQRASEQSSAILHGSFPVGWADAGDGDRATRLATEFFDGLQFCFLPGCWNSRNGQYVSFRQHKARLSNMKNPLA
jgi:hypothetical protein